MTVTVFGRVPFVDFQEDQYDQISFSELQNKEQAPTKDHQGQAGDRISPSTKKSKERASANKEQKGKKKQENSPPSTPR